MIRQLGGSFGVAIVSTYLERNIAINRVGLLPNISLYNPETVQCIQAFTQNFVSKGFPLEQARQQAYASLEGILMKQVSIITYSQVFSALGFFFIACLPLALLIKQVKVTGKISMDAH
jgi:DHA2 family multidrug resistance protein